MSQNDDQTNQVNDGSMEPTEVVTEPVSQPDVNDVPEAPESTEPQVDLTPPGAINPTEVKSSVEITKPCKKPIPEKFMDYGLRLSVLYTTLRGVEQYLEQHPTVEEAITEDFANSLSLATANTHVYNDMLLSASIQEGRSWAQAVNVDGVNLGAARPRIAKLKGGSDSLLVGDRALRMIASKLSDSQTLQIPLWASGIWICFEAPDLVEQDRLDRRIANERVRLGRNTRGAIFSNDSVYIADIIVDFMMERIFDCNVKGWTPEILRSLIRQPDIQTMAWGLGLSMYAKGFPLAQPCTADPNKCTYVAEELLDLSKIHWVDHTRINEKQRRFMLARDTKRTEEQILEYQAEFSEPASKTIQVLDGDISIVYKIPSIQEHLTSGIQWIEDIVNSAERTLGVQLDDEKKEDFFLSQANASRIRRYSHWIHSIVVNEDDEQSVITDRDTIEKVAVKLCNDTEVRKAIINGAVMYANNTLVTMVGLPNYECPSCGSWHHTEEGATKMLLPLDAVSVFFTLLQFSLLIKANA